jgi:murein DD-endopeptidase MepM/ murein hydrolase activator NlpD
VKGGLRPLLLAAALSSIVLLSAGSAAPQPMHCPGCRRAEPADFLLSGPLQQGALVRGIAPAGSLGLSLDGQPVPLAPDRNFVLGLDRDQGARIVLAARLENGATLSRELPVAPRSWRIERIDAARRPGGATEEFLRRRAIELRRIDAARAIRTAAEGWRQAFVLPARGRISGEFGSQRIYRGEPASYHSGLDIAPGAGAPVIAPADGVVVLAGPPIFSLEGNLVIVDHGMGLNSAFLHLATVAVRSGEAVRQGQRIGTVGATGRVTGPHLHWSVRWGAAKLDPRLVVGAAPAS